ncbi:MAG: hypothetical protein M1823_007890, partial [Watsoniomyces obsoletus]
MAFDVTTLVVFLVAVPLSLGIAVASGAPVAAGLIAAAVGGILAGIIGLMFNALFGVDYVVGLDGVNTGVANPETGTGLGGWPIGNYRQFYIQLAYVVACSGYAFVMSAILAYIVNYIPGLKLRASEEAELL